MASLWSIVTDPIGNQNYGNHVIKVTVNSWLLGMVKQQELDLGYFKQEVEGLIIAPSYWNIYHIKLPVCPSIHPSSDSNHYYTD